MENGSPPIHPQMHPQPLSIEGVTDRGTPGQESPKKSQETVMPHIPKELLSVSTEPSQKGGIEKEAVRIHSGSQPAQESAVEVHTGAQRVQEAVMVQLFPDRVQKEAIPVASSENVVFVDRSQLQKSTFETVTRNIPNCAQILKESENRFQNIERLCGAVEKGDWDKIISLYEKEDPSLLAKDALKAFHDQEISTEQFCTLTYLYALLQENPSAKIKVQRLFDMNGNIDPMAKYMFQQGLGGNQSFFTPKETTRIGEELFVRMKDRPPSEQCFFYIEYPSPPLSPTSIGDVLREKVGLRILDRFQMKGKQYRMIPSFSMIQSCVDAFGKENTVALSPTIGASSRADIRKNASARGRDIYTPFPGCSPPLFADGFPVRDVFEFIFHDIYHGHVCSQVPNEIKDETGRMADQIASLQTECANDKDVMIAPFLDAFYGRIIDMEFSLFLANDTMDNQAARFLLTLEMQTSLAIERLILSMETITPLDKRKGLPESARKRLERLDKLKEAMSSDKPLKEQILQLWERSAPEIIQRVAATICESGLLLRMHVMPPVLEDAILLSKNLTGSASLNSKLPGASLNAELLKIIQNNLVEYDKIMMEFVLSQLPA